MSDFQMNIFGDLEPVETAYAPKERETIKTRFRKMHGVDDKHRCGDCIYCVAKLRDRTYYKCEWMGVSSSEATDIRLKDPACDKWEERKTKNEEN